MAVRVSTPPSSRSQGQAALCWAPCGAPHAAAAHGRCHRQAGPRFLPQKCPERDRGLGAGLLLGPSQPVGFSVTANHAILCKCRPINWKLTRLLKVSHLRKTHAKGAPGGRKPEAEGIEEAGWARRSPQPCFLSGTCSLIPWLPSAGVPWKGGCRQVSEGPRGVRVPAFALCHLQLCPPCSVCPDPCASGF